MATVFRFPDRFAAARRETAAADRAVAEAEIVILPCVRRESLDRRPAVAAVERPTQLQA